FHRSGRLAPVSPLILRQEVRARLVDAEGLVGAPAGLFEHGLAAGGAVKFRGHVPGHKAALRAALTGIISKAPLGLALEHAGAALGAAPRHMLHDGLGVLALREARACQEAAKAAVLDDHLPAAQLADLLGLLLGH